jgi:hypothetical protein
MVSLLHLHYIQTFSLDARSHFFPSHDLYSIGRAVASFHFYYLFVFVVVGGCGLRYYALIVGGCEC